ncbi:MAG: InlB B-repeat-containing protein [Treponema sp.]|nr:InlB B-repeat-containing protein [Treponema sp.]
MKMKKILPFVIFMTLTLDGCSKLVNDLLDRFSPQSNTVETAADFSLNSITRAVSENPEIVTVSVNDDGTLTFTSVSPGTTTVTVTAEATNPEKGWQQIVTIVYEVTVDEEGYVTCEEKGKETVDIFPEKTITISSFDEVTDFTSVTVAESANESIVKTEVNPDGTVSLTSKSEGSTTITVTGKNSDNEDVYITYSLTVATDGTITIDSVSFTIVCTITFDSNGGRGTIESVHITKNESYTIDADSSKFSKQYHSITGWNTSSDGSGTSYTLTDTIEAVGSNLTLYAVWEANTLGPVVTLESIGGEPQIGFTYNNRTPLTSSSLSITLSAKTGFKNYLWKIDGVVVKDDTSNQFVFDPSSDDISAGHHKITLVVKDANGNYWSATAVVTVQK